MSYTEISGGVTAARGFLAGSAYCGIKASNPDRPDIALKIDLGRRSRRLVICGNRRLRRQRQG